MARGNRSHQTCYFEDGNGLGLGSRIAFGGEGAVYSLDADDTTVAKIYHETPDKELVKKLVAMITHINDELNSFTTWPKQLLFSAPGGPCVGFTMISAVGFNEAHKLYSPRDRKAEFDHADWGFLVRAAGNLSRAFASVHAAGHVIGDVNHSSVMFAPDATCRLIDCDSYQISIGDKVFPCRVGEPLHTAPELCGLPLQTTPRTANHDAFGLAVLIFELLFMGKHPFAGAYLGPGDPPLEEKMREFRFAYAPNAEDLLVAPPADSLSLEYVPQDLAEMFTLAFSAAGASSRGRPTARQWTEGLNKLFDSLTTCPIDPAHSYFAGAPECPWCRIERATGATLFNLGPAFRPNRSASFDLDAAWRAIESVNPPASPSDPAAITAVRKPSDKVRRARTRRRLEWAAALLVWLGGAGTMAFLGPRDIDGWFILILLGATGVYSFYRLRASMLRDAEFQLMAAEGHLHRLMESWSAEAGLARFTRLFDDLKSKRHELQSMPHSRAQKLSELERTLEPRLRRKHLERHRIAQHPIAGVNLSRCVTLASYGVESAADVTEAKLAGVPGVGPALRSALLTWRKDIESRFHFDRNAGIPPEEIEELDREIEQRGRHLEAELVSGANALSLTKSQIQTAQQVLAEPLREAMESLEQAKADVRAVAGI